MSLLVEIKRLGLRTKPALLKDIFFEVAPGTVHTIMGPSGCGKSSILSLIAGTLPAVFEWQGRVEIDATSIGQLPVQQRKVGLLFQDDLLFAHLSVGENLLFAMSSGSQSQRLEQMRAALAEVELSKFEKASPLNLSGGQRSRVALMRALLAKPRALLLDEPFSKLDAQLKSKIRDFVFAAAKTRNIPVVLVTHDPQDIADSNFLTQLG
jgi:putative thiamine transport system ATP-binding protein